MTLAFVNQYRFITDYSPKFFLYDQRLTAAMTNHIIQAYKQAPWRMQIQWIGMFLLGLIILVSVAGIYLNVSATATATGYEIQDLIAESEDLERSIADLETQLATLTSAAVMQQRALDMGFQSVSSDAINYVVVPDYPGRQPAVMAPSPDASMITEPIIRVDYTQSLWEWLFQGFIQPLQQSEQGK